VRVAAIQHDIVWEDAPATHEHVAPLIAKAASDGARLVVLTEMFSVGFTMATDRVAQPADGPSARFLFEQATTHGVWLAGSIPCRATTEGDKPTNRMLLVSPDGVVAHYDKLHPFSFAGEDEHYAPGDATITVGVDGVRVTPFVCYDLRFANVFWDVAAGTDLYLVVANWPDARRHHWTALLTARAIEDQAYVVGVNRVGTGGGLSYAGDSVILDPMGAVLAAAGSDETLIAADVDPAVVTDVRARFPFLADRR